MTLTISVAISVLIDSITY